MLIALGKLRAEASTANTRTGMWVAAFEDWHRAGLRQARRALTSRACAWRAAILRPYIALQDKQL
jgi:hypothetical protein